MALTLRQQAELLAQVKRARRDLSEFIAGLDAIKASYDELGADVVTFLSGYLKPAEWQTIRSTARGWLDTLDTRIEAAQGDGIEALRPAPAVGGGDGGVTA